MIKSMFEELDRKTYETYLEEHSFYLNLGIDIDEYKSQFKEASQSEDESKGINRKIHKNIWESVDPKNNVPFAAELDDLVRLHYLVVSRKVTTILEFGISGINLTNSDVLGGLKGVVKVDSLDMKTFLRTRI